MEYGLLSKSLAEQFGGTYSDVRSGMGLQQEIEKLTQKTFLIEKKEIKNRIRGGDSFVTAVPIQVNTRYVLDHHQRKNQYDYFTFNLKQGEAVALRVFPTPTCIKITGSQVEEKSSTICWAEGFRFVLIDGSQKELQRLADYRVDTQHETKWFTSSSPGVTPHYLVVGSPSNDMHKDHEFMLATKQGEITVSTQHIGDANSERDAGDSFAMAISIAPGLYEMNRLSEPQDMMDIFKITVPAGNLLKAVVGGKKGSQYANETDVEMVGELGEIISKGRIGEGKSASYELPASAAPRTVYIRLKLDEKNYEDQQFLEYTLAYNLTPSAVTAAEAPTPPPSVGTSEKDQATPRGGATAVTPKGFQIWFLWIILGFVLFTTAILFFFLRQIKKQSIRTSGFGKGLGWYEIAASIVGFGTGVYAVTFLPSTGTQVFVFVLLILSGGLGILAGAKLLAKKSLTLSFIWLYLQLPWLSLNLHWVGFDYRWALGIGAPLHLLIEYTKNWFVSFGIHPRLGVDIYLNGFVSSRGEGFQLGLGINLVALILLCLLFFYRKKTKTGN